jgi:metal-sulfur cluster biosynthetic enzyme
MEAAQDPMTRKLENIADSNTPTTEVQGQGERVVTVAITLTAPGCGMGDILVDDVRSKLQMVPTVDRVDVTLTFDPPWNHSMMSDVARLETGMF